MFYRRTHCTIAQVLVLTICNIRKTRWADSVSEQNNFLDSTVSPSSLDPRVGDSWIRIQIYQHYQRFVNFFLKALLAPVFKMDMIDKTYMVEIVDMVPQCFDGQF